MKYAELPDDIKRDAETLAKTFVEVTNGDTASGGIVAGFIEAALMNERSKRYANEVTGTGVDSQAWRALEMARQYITAVPEASKLDGDAVVAAIDAALGE